MIERRCSEMPWDHGTAWMSWGAARFLAGGSSRAWGSLGLVVGAGSPALGGYREAYQNADYAVYVLGSGAR